MLLGMCFVRRAPAPPPPPDPVVRIITAEGELKRLLGELEAADRGLLDWIDELEEGIARAAQVYINKQQAKDAEIKSYRSLLATSEAVQGAIKAALNQ